MATVLYPHFGYMIFFCLVGGGFDSNHADVTIVSGRIGSWIMFPICGVYNMRKTTWNHKTPGR